MIFAISNIDRFCLQISKRSYFVDEAGVYCSTEDIQMNVVHTKQNKMIETGLPIYVSLDHRPTQETIETQTYRTQTVRNRGKDSVPGHHELLDIIRVCQIAEESR